LGPIPNPQSPIPIDRSFLKILSESRTKFIKINKLNILFSEKLF
jgi:hypothetical protein